MIIIDRGPLVVDLLERGYKVAVVRGRLLIDPALPIDEFEVNFESMAAEIVDKCGINGFLYQDYKTGRYGEHKAEGITLQFLSLRNGGSPAYMIFNANLSRARTSKYGAAGSPLPGKQFRITRNHLFYSFWIAAGQPLPPRLSSFHDYMGNLQGLIFTGKYSKEQRIQKDTLRPLSLTHDQILDRFGIQKTYGGRTLTEQSPNNIQTGAIQPTGNPHTVETYKESALDQYWWETEVDSATGARRHDYSVPRRYASADIPGYDDAVTRENDDDFDVPF
ncbi:hypothetical protein [Microbulbifer marinus]|uniref:Uncharacterized protein n=1 Tax=Microbulbifer marinus TaxID=658218 RepID=A0A1H3YY57_9GAMM|nr:hypothetical protein [Microbulbifer marinus]SEA16435.1 hypothetical protein SAMN05216562_2058 [Microbulbifer marinus]